MTVAEVMAALSKLPAHLPVRVAVEVSDDEGGSYTDFGEAAEIKWQGGWVEVEFE